MLIDLHIHTKRGSRCSSLDSKELVKQAKKMRLDAVCITDHNTFEAVQVTKEAGKEEGLLVFGGMEVRCREGDILTFGLQEPPKSGIPASELLEIVKSSGAAAIIAHPFRTSAPSLGRRICEISGFDAIEVLNGNSTEGENEMAALAAAKLRLPGTGGSDAHFRSSVGRYATHFEDDSIGSEQELIDAIKSGRYEPKRLKE